VLPADIRVTVIACALRSGRVSLERVLALHPKCTSNIERKHLYSSIGYASHKRAVLDWCLDGDIKLQDMFYPMMSCSASGTSGADAAWQFLQDRFDELAAALASASPSLFNAVIACCTSAFTSNEKADEISKFFEEHPRPDNQRKIDQIIEGMRASAVMLDRIRESKVADKAFWTSLKWTA